MCENSHRHHQPHAHHPQHAAHTHPFPQVTTSHTDFAEALGGTLPIVMGLCEYLIKKQGTLAPAPAYSPAPSPSKPPVPTKDGQDLWNFAIGLQAHADGPNPASPPECRKANGQYFPGGFGWLATDPPPSSSCTATIPVGGWVDGDPGASVPAYCKPGKDAGNAMAKYVGTTAFLPITDEWDGSRGAHGQYHITGVVAFFVAGFVSQPSAGTYEMYQQRTTICNSKCFWGWFTSGILPISAATPPIGGTDYGAEQIAPAG